MCNIGLSAKAAHVKHVHSASVPRIGSCASQATNTVWPVHSYFAATGKGCCKHWSTCQTLDPLQWEMHTKMCWRFAGCDTKCCTCAHQQPSPGHLHQSTCAVLTQLCSFAYSCAGFTQLCSLGTLWCRLVHLVGVAEGARQRPSIQGVGCGTHFAQRCCCASQPAAAWSDKSGDSCLFKLL